MEVSAQPTAVAVVGAGSMAAEHIRAFQDVPGTRVAGIHSRTRQRAEQLAVQYGISLVCDSVAELYEKTQADLVLVTVFETAMRDVAIECCRYPWTLFLEKPPGMHLAAAEAIHQAASQAKRQVLVGLNRRFLASTRAAADDLASNTGPRFIYVQDQQDLAVARTLRHPPEVVENWMYANSIHLVDYLSFLGRGKVTEVKHVAPWSAAAPGVVLAQVSFDSGDSGLYQGIWNGPGPWAVAVSTPAKRWEMRPLEQGTFQRAGERKLEPVPASEWDSRFKPGFRSQAEHAVAAVRGNPNQSPTLAEALETMRLIARIFQK